MIRRIIAVLTFVTGILRGVLLTLFLGLVAMVLATYLGAVWAVAIGAGILGLIAGVLASKRLWFSDRPAPRVEPAPVPVRLPGVQDAFERLLARQRVLAALLIAALLALSALRFAIARNWPAPFGLSPERLLVVALLVVATALPLGLLNWRCPNCRRNLGRTLSVRQCPKCGIVLRG